MSRQDGSVEAGKVDVIVEARRQQELLKEMASVNWTSG